MGPHGSWTRAFHETLGHTLYWIAAFIILAGAIVAYTRRDGQRKKAEADARLQHRRQVDETDPSGDLPPDDCT